LFPVYTPADREALKDELIALARADPRITGGALTGSASVGREDRYSDIDLAFGVRTAADVLGVLDDRTSWMRQNHGLVDHLDVKTGSWVYRVFLLPSTLQVDVACVPAEEFGARAPTFRLLFGAASERAHEPRPAAHDLIGWAWLYALHARSSIARGQRWHAEYMVSAIRDQVVALACLRHRLPVAYARGADSLPRTILDSLEGAIVRDLTATELVRAMRAAIDALVGEIRHADIGLAGTLEPTLRELVATANP
jgi:hypothetical protein